MTKNSNTLPTGRTPEPGSLASYTVGFILSIILTLAAYALVVNKILGGWDLVFALMGLAVAQLLVQLIFFLHLASESKPRWNLISFLFMLSIVLVIAGGSLWIMDNLDYNHNMSASETDQAIIRDELIKH